MLSSSGWIWIGVRTQDGIEGGWLGMHRRKKSLRYIFEKPDMRKKQEDLYW